MEESDKISADTHRYVKLLGDLSTGVAGQVLDAITLQGLEVLEARRGRLLCKFVVPARLSGRDGNWEVGAVAALVDVVGGAAQYSLSGEIRVAVNISLSYCSPAKIQEEVVIEAKAVGEEGRLSIVLVEIRRKGDDGLLVALAKLSSASHKAHHNVISKL